MEHQELTPEEELHYANYGQVDDCDCCGNMIAITNWHDGADYLTWNERGNKLYCRKCL